MTDQTTPAVVDKERILDLTRRHVAPHRVDVWEQSGTQIVLGAREGYRMWDVDGHELLDLHLNGGTYNLGHRHPELVAELVAATGEVDIGNHHFASRERALLGERLAALTPGDLTYSVFAPSGSEAMDVAVRTARRATGRRRIVALDAGYHGRSGISGGIGQDTGARYFLSDLGAENTTVPFGDLDALEVALAGDDVAAVVLETVPATYGFPEVPEGYLEGAARLARAAGTLYVADEVQVGLGRTGELWGVEHFGVQPDVLVTGKGLSGGLYPMAAAVLSADVAGWLHENGWGYVSTFGGSEIGCRVARKVLEITTRPEVQEHVRALVHRFATGLAVLRAREPWLVEVRQTGLLIGLRVGHPSGAVYLQQELHERGVWAIASGFDTSVLQLKPGLLLDDATADDVLARLGDALAVAKTIDRPIPRRHVDATGRR
ncbi:aminotransferase class III-fold pyridoxal phosphate-dependent enzyme [Patulibacter sp. S7RM1-6]